MTITIPTFNVKDWKSTVSSVLTATLFLTAALLASPQLQTTLSPKALLWIGGVQSVAKILIGLITQDAGTVQAITPTSGGQVVTVASHEVPSVPGAVAVVPAASTAPVSK